MFVVRKVVSHYLNQNINMLVIPVRFQIDKQTAREREREREDKRVIH